MSDLSIPLMSMEPLAAADMADASEPFVWPSPELSGYAAPVNAAATPSCEVEGLNGQSSSGRMTLFDPQDGLVQMRPAASRSPVLLRFDQFRRLRLTQPLELQPLASKPDLVDRLVERPPVPFRIHFKDQSVWEGLTVGHHEESFGLFLFEPDGVGALRQVFVPRLAYASAEIGLRIGEALVAQRVATPEQVGQALAEQQVLRQRRLGSLLVVRQIITTEELNLAIERQARMPIVRIGEALLALGYITPEQLESALEQQRRDRNVPLGELLVARGHVSRGDLQTALARKMGYPLVDVTRFPFEAVAVARLPYATAARWPALPLLMRNGRLVVALEDPLQRRALEEIEFAAQCKLVPVLARSGELAAAVERAYRQAGSLPVVAAVPMPTAFAAAAATAAIAATAATPGQALPRVAQASDDVVAGWVNDLIQQAWSQGATDIHIECPVGADDIRLRLRKAGRLALHARWPSGHGPAVLARLKTLCGLDVAQRQRSQHGRLNFSQHLPGAELELRLSTLPTHSGCEDAVVQLRTPAVLLALDALHMRPVVLTGVQKALAQGLAPGRGLLLFVGPQGCGKTTSLHAALKAVNSPERKLWATEDSIDITQDGVRQVLVNARGGWTTADALQGFMQADADVLAVADIDSPAAAHAAVQAALGGALVLAGVRARTAAEGLARLLDLGVDPYNLADAWLGALGQRLVRGLCSSCASVRPASSDDEAALLHEHLQPFRNIDSPHDGPAVLADWRGRFGGAAFASERRQTPRSQRPTPVPHYTAVGCTACNNTGYQGALGLQEFMPGSDGLRRLLQRGAGAAELQRLAQREGMLTLRQDGVDKVLAGRTTLGEVRAAT